MGGKRSPARLVVALSVAGVLAIFLVYTALAGGGTPSLRPSQLAGQSHSTAGMRFRVRDVSGSASTRVVYHGSKPDLFRTGRDIVVDGRLHNGRFVAVPGTLVTKCPSKYTPKQG